MWLSPQSAPLVEVQPVPAESSVTPVAGAASGAVSGPGVVVRSRGGVAFGGNSETAKIGDCAVLHDYFE
ncbi:hypothetical protein Areg01_08910 [Actinoplanes regularis]|nr:hypothetical protein Areg01_08910 [Actinoplanes regularis]